MGGTDRLIDERKVGPAKNEVSVLKAKTALSLSDTSATVSCISDTDIAVNVDGFKAPFAF